MYRYDGNGNRIEKQALDGLTRYSYDANNRLVRVEYPNIMGELPQFETLGYDNAGNRVARKTNEVSEAYRYDNCNRLLELQKCYYDEAREDETLYYCYDKQGNLLSDGTLEYLYDGFNRVAEVKTSAGDVQKNYYDAEGLRHEMEENGRLVQFLYAEREVIAETESDGNVIRYIRGLGLICSDSEKAKTYYHYVSDEQGSIIHVTEGENKTSQEEAKTHEVLNTYVYDAFGNTVSCQERVHNRFRYLGEQHDPVTQQYYLKARYYNPVIARFTQEDTYYGDGLNLYQYCANNPVRYKDPSGHCAIDQNAYQRYLDVGADTETAKVAAELYPNLSSKLDIVKKYQNDGYNAADALMLADYEIIHGPDNAAKFAENNVAKSSPAVTPTTDVNSNWRALERLESSRNSGERISNGLNIIDGKVDGKIPLADYDNYRTLSINNPSSDTMTLGKYEPTIRTDGTKDFSIPGPGAYTVKAGETTYFSLGTEWDKITATYGLDAAGKDMFKLFNIPALDDAVANGKTIRFSHDPMAYGDCALKWEWDYLVNTHGYTSYIKKGEFWYAIK